MKRVGRRVVSGLVAALLVLPVIAAAVAAADVNDPALTGPSRAITFPVVGKVSYTDTFGAPRGTTRLHQGQDLMGSKMQPLVAAADGIVSRVTLPQASYGYSVVITDAEGWSYHYLHVNNDTPGTDDGQAALEHVYAPGIVAGARVVAGQVVAFLGDSGNAETTSPHLHFEMHDPTGVAVNPMAALTAATRLDAPNGPAPVLRRLAGADRAGTAVAASREGWPQGSTEIVVASGSSYAEALPASVLAARRAAPLLLASGETLDPAVEDEVGRLGATAATVVGSVPAEIDGALQALGLTVTRVAGADAISTANSLARLLGAEDRTAVLVNAERFPDGISAAGLAAPRGWPILLSRSTTIPQPTVDTMRALGITRVYVIGGTAVLSERIAAFVPGGIRLAGDDRYATSVATAEESVRLGPVSFGTTWLATGTNYPDALTAGSLAARTGGVVLLVDGMGRSADGATREFLAASAADVSVRGVLGGYAAVTPLTDAEVAQLIGG